MRRSSVTTLLATAAILSATPAVATADIVLTDAATTGADDPLQAWSGSSGGSVNAGSAGGMAILFGGTKQMCLTVGSAMAILGKSTFGCDAIRDIRD
ncbi:hypothetical protein JK358_30265 [Nocardia sp. 2]|uniref:Secreted protein n=1 Tax=Nocardia acididurans TaxID=2802282 RepID=A0ABS1MEH9_9NOCA|nr:hypothetical protein [Nocardia acididurans]MBL1078696.1 hypothetical protein [Nocardia acididurans]